MTYQEALARLRNHSNLGNGGEDSSLLFVLWKADRDGVFPTLADHVQDVLDCLVQVNVELNGQRPSETFHRSDPRVISEVAYVVSGLLVALLQKHRKWSLARRFSPEQMTQLVEAALQLGMAWDMVLAGDHDDLRGELAAEWSATA
jgi:hypothetical protein